MAVLGTEVGLTAGKAVETKGSVRVGDGIALSLYAVHGQDGGFGFESEGRFGLLPCVGGL